MKKRKKIRKPKPIIVTHDYHHIRPKSRGGDSHISNLLYMRIKRHRTLHKMFGYQTLRMIFLTIKETNHRLIMSDADNLANWLDLFGDKTNGEVLALLERVIRAKEAQRR